MTAPPERTLIDELLDEQRDLTAAGEFARAKDRNEIGIPHYRQLLPLITPQPGRQYAFEVDLDKCSGCKACVTACHSLNGLDDGESWREVGTLFGEALVLEARGGNRVEPVQQTVTTACHHCIEPGCLQGCPVLAYDKDPITGIVRHLDDQCIGCSYCILKCPYDVPKYSAHRGIVRKCDLCHGRIAAGEAPACAQACPSDAIRIVLVEQESVRQQFRPQRSAASGAALWLPDSPFPAHTLPTTRYLTKRDVPGLRSSQHERSRPQSPHWPLILMLVMSQAGIGAFMAATFSQPASRLLAVVALLWLATGLGASVFHLGRPAKAWRVWMGWRTSWLSREAIALNLFAGVAAAGIVLRNSGTAWAVIIAVLGLLALLTQTMVYADTHRAFWSLARTGPRFLGTTLVMGLAFALLLNPLPSLALALIVTTLVKLGCECSVLQHADSSSDTWTELRRTAVLQWERLRPVLAIRLFAGLCGGVGLPFLILTNRGSPPVVAMIFALCVLAELAERWLFFTSVAPDRMP
ncbi:MAG: formate dehydrogenase iron-sulfur subunit [Verrucomicrobiota bacterium]|jgi:Fe-S-cluster-containing dehydrogenase component/DMSO reductase anchor subunit